jgi:hypothetical protein
MQAKDAELSRSHYDLLTKPSSILADSKTLVAEVLSVTEPELYLLGKNAIAPLAEAVLEIHASCFAVYPESLVLVRLRKESIRDNAFGLTRLLLLSARDCVGRLSPGDDDATTSDKFQSAFWCYCETSEEISLIVSEVRRAILVKRTAVTYTYPCLPQQRFLADFGGEEAIVSPDRWRAIKLGGRQFGFDETGVVAAMSGFNTETHVLNVSSFGSNVAFVREHTVDESVATLCTSLNISRVER